MIARAISGRARGLGLGFAGVLVLFAAAARADDAKLAIVRPGAGFIGPDGSSVVPLQVVVQKKTPAGIKVAKITAKLGKILSTRVVDSDRVLFLYALPKKSQEVAEVFDVSLTLDGGERTETFPFRFAPPEAPSLAVLVEPQILGAGERDKTPISFSATAGGKDLEGITGQANPGTLEALRVTRFESSIRAKAQLRSLEVPPDAPSYVLFLAAASSQGGYAAKTAGVAIEAPVRVSLDLPAGSELSIEGAANDPAPVVAPADGRTVIENVRVRYGGRVRAFAKKGGKRREVSLVIRSSVPQGVAVAIPGQAVADGGTGPTILVAVPPSPFGGEVMWPEVKVEGAELLSSTRVASDIRALVIRRPTNPWTATVLLDDQAIGTIDFTALRGQKIEAASIPTKGGERAAIEIRVKDLFGQLTDWPEPRARVEGGRGLEALRLSKGVYRAAIPSGAEGEVGSMAKLVAEIAQPPSIAGEVLDAASAAITVKLAGLPQAIASKDEASAAEGGSIQTAVEPQVAPKVGLSALVLAGTTFGSLLIYGGGVLAEVRLPVLDHRLAVRAGLELWHGSGSASKFVQDGRAQDARVSAGGLLIPIDLGFALVHADEFELFLRAGGAIRFDRVALEIGGDNRGGGRGTGIGGRVSMDADFALGAGALVVGIGLDGIGISGSGFSGLLAEYNLDHKFSGSLTSVRADAAYRFWF